MLQNAIRNLKNQEGEGEGGFTLIELLVVILIIGILAAIALPTFLGQSDKAKDSSAKSDARNMVSQVESCYTTTSTYATCGTDATGAVASGSSLDPGGVKAVVTPSTTAPTQAYTVTAKSDTTNTFSIAKAANGVDSLDKGGITGVVADGTATGYNVTATSDTKNTYKITKGPSGVTRDCSVPSDGSDKGGCKAAKGASATW